MLGEDTQENDVSAVIAAGSTRHSTKSTGVLLVIRETQPFI
jgi:hypothetical protein